VPLTHVGAAREDRGQSILVALERRTAGGVRDAMA
jgi:hypothetical protein